MNVEIYEGVKEQKKDLKIEKKKYEKMEEEEDEK